MDLDRKAWTVGLEFLTAAIAADALTERLGPPDSSLFWVTRRWTFAGTTVLQTGRHVVVLEKF